MKKAIFYDRDGIILEMVYDQEHGIIDTVRRKEQVVLVPGIISLLRYATSLGYLNIIISNQPGIGLKKITKQQFDTITEEYVHKLQQHDIEIDAIYHCFHHPFAKDIVYQKVCNCRKPKPGLLLQAAQEYSIDLEKSWMIGDGVNDIMAGSIVGCKTVLMANINESEYLRIVEEKLQKIKPTHMIKRLEEIIEFIKN